MVEVRGRYKAIKNTATNSTHRLIRSTCCFSTSAMALLFTVHGLPAVSMPEGQSQSLVPRAFSRSNPAWLNFDCTGVEAVCDADGMPILCFGSPNPVQYKKRRNTPNRENSGFSSGLLRPKRQQTLTDKGIMILQEVLDKTGRSAEETTMASSEQGGWGEIMVPSILTRTKVSYSIALGYYSYIILG